MTMALNLKLTRPVPDMDAYVSRLLAAEHHEHRVARPLCPLCPGGVRRYREVVPPRERRPDYARRPGPNQKSWAWYERVRAAGGEWLVVDTRVSTAAAKTTAQRWKRRQTRGIEIRTRGCEIHARWSGG